MDDKWDKDLKNRIRDVFDNYKDEHADEGWLLLREKFPEKAKRRIAAWVWWAPAPAILLLFLGILWFRPAPEKPQSSKYSHANDFLIIGTIFDPKGYAFPGVELRIRRSNEKKYRWDSYTNSRGEFAVRVPQGLDYEMVVHAKGFADQTRALDAKTGVSEARIVFRMVAAEGGKK